MLSPLPSPFSEPSSGFLSQYSSAFTSEASSVVATDALGPSCTSIEEYVKAIRGKVSPVASATQIDLPPLLQGLSDVHIRREVMKAVHSLSGHAVDVCDEDADCDGGDSSKAFFVADLSEVFKMQQRWMTCLPEIEPHYAIKCNPDPMVLRLLASLGVGFDCASKSEIDTVLDVLQDELYASATANTDRIIFANPCKPATFISHALKTGVRTMTFDNADELHKIARVYRKLQAQQSSIVSPQLVLRIVTDDSKALCQLSAKYGASLESVPHVLRTAKSLDLNVIGVSFHVGSGTSDPTVYAAEIRRARQVFDMGKSVFEDGEGYEMSLLDIGGGFDADGTFFEIAAKTIKSTLAECFPEWEYERVRGPREMAPSVASDGAPRKLLRIIAEPGRFFVSRAFKLACNVIAMRVPVPTENEATDVERPNVMYYINDGVYGAFNCIMFDHQMPTPYALTVRGEVLPPSLSLSNTTAVPTQSAATHTCSVWGPTCDSLDCITRAAELPKDLRVGDWLGFDNMGAYTVCAASRFNGFDVSRVIYTTGER
ncbi:hypothetical protein FISHEDRAFT_47885 [Fistulina hepatica ATCC 64428]|uniref:ornithine decarboxylase n=1 Tax=Fistulina hepatica ATCC 64428 TaxID=1128425 RepID=A0A0D7A5R5_9AGAR|nr:hypothetical protein FISHEDRAFT_47885 [Fistulina hepatica ATCC 64428]